MCFSQYHEDDFMALTDNSRAWYELQTKRGNTLVLQDTILPAANEGRIYLFNADRKAIVEYDKAIVSEKLVLLDDDQQQQADSDFGSDWQSASHAFLKAHGKHSPASQASASLSDESDSTTDDSFEDDSLDSDDDDFDDSDFDDEDDD